jgi:hypothetical protein
MVVPEPESYPRQTLLPQQVQRSRSRTPLYIGLALLLVLVGGVIVWRIFVSSGEDTRAAYCSALKRLTHNGDLQATLSHADVKSLNQVLTVQRLAPAAVRGDWTTLQSLVTTGQSSSPNVLTAIKALTALRSIADDARRHCGIPMQIPLSP